MLGTEELNVVAASRAAISVGLANTGTATGNAGLAPRDSVLASSAAALDDRLVMSIRSGALRVAAVFDPDDAPAEPVDGAATGRRSSD